MISDFFMIVAFLARDITSLSLKNILEKNINYTKPLQWFDYIGSKMLPNVRKQTVSKIEVIKKYY